MMKIKKVVSLTLAFTIVMSSVSTVAYADESTRDSSNASSEKMVAYAGDLMTEEEAKELATSMELAESNDFFSVDEELESAITFTSDSEVEAYIKDKALLTTAPDVIEDIEVAENRYVSRNKDIETNEYTLGFKNADGSNTMRVFAFPVKYTDLDGKEKDITLDIKDNEDGSFVTENNSVITTFPEKEEDGISLEYEDIDITLVPVESYFVTPLLEEKLENERIENVEGEIIDRRKEGYFAEDSWTKTAKSSLLQKEIESEQIELEKMNEGATLSEDGKTVCYQWQDKTSLEYSLTYTGFKEDIVVEEYTGQTEYNFLLHTNGLKLENIEGSYFLTDDKGSIKATIGDIIIFTADERNNTLGEMECEAIKENEIYKMIIKVDADYLKDEKTVYPIRIDPSIEVSYSSDGDGAIQDVTINSNAGSNGSATILTVGKRNTYGKSRVLMKFPGLDLSAIRSYHLITYAGVELRDLMCEQEQMAVLCYAFTGNTWSESTATWDSVGKSEFITEYGQSTRQISYANGSELSSVHRYSFKITGAVHGWKKGTYSQSKGLIFKATDTVEGGSTEKYKTFASYNRSAYRPSLTIQYSATASTGSIFVPYNNNYHSLVANYVHPYKFTAPATDQYSIWTTGNLSTKVYVFDSSGMVTPKASNKGSGHGNNCCVTYEMTGGRTYYFVIQGTSATVQGTYGLRVYRGLPMSGSEKPSYEEEFNEDHGSNDSWVLTNNCYTYAMAAWMDPSGGNNEYQPGPGDYAGNPIPITLNAATAQNVVYEAIQDDLVSWGYSEDDILISTETSMPPEGYYKIALLLESGGGFHFLRQVSDRNGAWAHKPNSQEVQFIDTNGKLIFNPRTAVFSDYPTFVCYYVIKSHIYTFY